MEQALAFHHGPVLDNIYAADVKNSLTVRWQAVRQWEADERAVLVDIDFLHSQARELENRREQVAREISEDAAKKQRIVKVSFPHPRCVSGM